MFVMAASATVEVATVLPETGLVTETVGAVVPVVLVPEFVVPEF